MSDWSLPSLLALAYLGGHSLLILTARNRPSRSATILLVNLLLSAFFLIVLWGGGAWLESFWGRLVRLWAPVVFFWWAYTWAGRALHVYHSPDTSWDDRLIAAEERLFGQPSLTWALNPRRFLTEAMHFFYASYYLYTPALGIWFHASGRIVEFEAMSSAVLLGYAVSYLLFSLVPVRGPRWGLLEAGLLDRSRQVLSGYWITAQMNRVMYGGVAHRGGAMPSSHSSTAVVFAIWSWRAWGWEGGIIALVLVAGMWAGSVYGRYHYVIDIMAGAALGLVAVILSDAIFAL